MKHFLYKHILRAKYMVNKRFFWKFNSAEDYAEKLGGKQIVWSIDYNKLMTVNNDFYNDVHPDAYNFNPFQ